MNYQIDPRIRSLRSAGAPILSLAILFCALARAQDGAGGTNLDQQDSAEHNGAIVALTDTGRIDIHVRDSEIVAVLEMISFQLKTNIVTGAAVSGTVSANLYGVTLSEALDSILIPRGLRYTRLGNTIFVGTADEIAAQLPPPQTRLFRLQYVSMAEAVKVLRSIVGKDGVVTAGGEPGSGGDPQVAMPPDGFGDAGTDYVVVTASEGLLEDVSRILKEIDVRPQQVLIEATILRATLNEDNQFGIDFTLLGGVDFQNVSSSSNASADLQTGSLPPAKFDRTTVNANTNLIGNNLTSGFSFGIIRNGVAFFVRALEEVTDVTVVANPKIIALNKQDAEVIVGRRDGYVTTTVTQTAAIQTIQFLETGTQIKLRPLILDDGTVRLTVHPKDSNGGLTAANLPFEETTEASASILVRDGNTVMIGGLFRERTTSSRGQVPLVGDIPGLGLLFQRRLDQTVREEVILLLTVHVLKDTPEENARFATLLDDVERIRIGSRRGLLGIGRERLAQAFYREAISQMEAGDEPLALFNARLALYNNPRHQSAVRLRQRLTQRRLWDNEGSRMRRFILDMIDTDPSSDKPTPGFARPEVDLNVLREDPLSEKPEEDEDSP